MKDGGPAFPQVRRLAVDDFELCDCGRRNLDHANFGDGQCDYCDCAFWRKDAALSHAREKEQS